MPTETVLLTLKRGEQLPQRVYLGMQSLKVTEYIPTTQRCNNCQLYGHAGTICAKPPKCAKSGSKHKTNDCQTQLMIDKCVNFGGLHRTGNKICLYTQQAADITCTAAHNGISYAAAA